MLIVSSRYEQFRSMFYIKMNASLLFFNSHSASPLGDLNSGVHGCRFVCSKTFHYTYIPYSNEKLSFNYNVYLDLFDKIDLFRSVHFKPMESVYITVQFVCTIECHLLAVHYSLLAKHFRLHSSVLS